MASILFGGDEEHSEENSLHKDLIARLKQEHDITFVNSGKGMLFELFRSHAEGLSALVPKNYDVIVYDAQLFFGCCDAQKRAELFEEHVVGYLKFAQTPIIVLADAAVAEKIKPVVESAGFKHVQMPYSIDVVLQEVTIVIKK
ncbi:hypothetical protein HY485_03965 [Candidatus Woesearchaeota archaeon]|nr:hypothetical protein [Candidatus Woesearchaeota archaeon]